MCIKIVVNNDMITYFYDYLLKSKLNRESIKYLLIYIYKFNLQLVNWFFYLAKSEICFLVIRLFLLISNESLRFSKKDINTKILYYNTHKSDQDTRKRKKKKTIRNDMKHAILQSKINN